MLSHNEKAAISFMILSVYILVLSTILLLLGANAASAVAGILSFVIFIFGMMIF